MKLENKIKKLVISIMFISMLMTLTLSMLYVHAEMKLHIYVNDHPHIYEVNAGDKLEIGYIHSIHLTPVRELFLIKNDRSFRLLSIEYDDVGWGTPYYYQKQADKKHILLKHEPENELTWNDLNYGFISMNKPKFYINNQLLQLNFKNTNMIKIFVTK